MAIPHKGTIIMATEPEKKTSDDSDGEIVEVETMTRITRKAADGSRTSETYTVHSGGGFSVSKGKSS